MNDEEIIDVRFKNNETGEIDKTEQKTIRTNIFQPTAIEKGWLKKPIRRFCKFMLNMTEPNQNRFIRIHNVLKPYIMYPALKFIKWVISNKHFVEHDNQIVNEWYNNHIRIYRASFHKSVEDIWEHLIYTQTCMNPKTGAKFKEEYPTSKDFIKSYMESRKKLKMLGCMDARKLVCNVHVTEMLEDTADREWCNSFILRVTHETMMLYGLDVKERGKVPLPDQYPLYTSNGPYNPEYFFENAWRPIWTHPNDRGQESTIPPMLKPPLDPVVLKGVLDDMTNNKEGIIK